jgi:hypothetical protein
MASLAISTEKDMSKIRNTMRKLLLAQRCSPTIVARSIAAISILTEVVLPLGLAINVDIASILREERKTVELICEMRCVNELMPYMSELQTSLRYAVDDVRVMQKSGRLGIAMRLW